MPGRGEHQSTYCPCKLIGVSLLLLVHNHEFSQALHNVSQCFGQQLVADALCRAGVQLAPAKCFFSLELPIARPQVLAG